MMACTVGSSHDLLPDYIAEVSNANSVLDQFITSTLNGTEHQGSDWKPLVKGKGHIGKGHIKVQALRQNCNFVIINGSLSEDRSMVR